MTDTITRTEIAAQLEAVQAKADTRLEKALGEIRAEFAKISERMSGVERYTSGLKSTIIITGISVFVGFSAAMIAVLGYGGQMFGNGLTLNQAISATASDAAAKAIEQYTRQHDASPQRLPVAPPHS